MAHEGAVTRSGGLGVMRQFIGKVRDDTTVRDLLVSVAPDRIRAAAEEIDRSELLMMERDSEDDQMAYAHALVEWGEAGGYEQETLWDQCTVAALGIPYEQAQWRKVTTLSGGEQKRLVLEALLRGPEEVLLLDEPDNYLDVPTKRWLEEALVASPKTVLFISHDRELLDRVATRVATLEPGGAELDRDDAVGRAREQLAVVGDQQHRLRRLPQLVLEPALAWHVEVVVRFVKQQHLFGAAQQRLERETLLLTPGERAEIAPAGPLERHTERGHRAVVPDRLLLLASGIGVLGERRRVAHLARRVVVLHDGEFGCLELERRLPHPLRGHRDQQARDAGRHGRLRATLRRAVGAVAAADRPVPDELVHHAEPAVDRHAALVRAQPTADDAEQRRLPRPVRADQRRRRALADAERDVGQQRPLAPWLMPL